MVYIKHDLPNRLKGMPSPVFRLAKRKIHKLCQSNAGRLFSLVTPAQVPMSPLAKKATATVNSTRVIPALN